NEIGADVVLLCADRFAQGGHLQAAQQLYREILKKEPDTLHGLWASYQIARASQAANQSAEALDLFTRVSKTDKDVLLASAAAAQLARTFASETSAMAPEAR